MMPSLIMSLKNIRKYREAVDLIQEALIRKANLSYNNIIKSEIKSTKNARILLYLKWLML